MSRPMMIPFGPQHPAFLEPMNLSLEITEEKVSSVKVNIGYNHRGMEYALALDYKKTQYLVERVCGICSFHHSSVYCQAMEAIFGVEAPERAKIIRTIFMELQRLTSHLLALGHISESAGYESLFMRSFAVREHIMRLLNRLTGSRVHYSVNIIGGVRTDISSEGVRDILSVIDKIRPEIKALRDVFLNDVTLVHRLSGVGKLTIDEARDWCAVGPVARASGIREDARLDGFAAYGKIAFHPIVREEGDAFARTAVRAEECIQSLDLIEQCLSIMKNGETAVATKKLPAGSFYSRVEAPRGELIYFLRSEEKKLSRLKIKTPASVNVPILAAIIKNSSLADVPVIAASIDPCICCTDR
ncbi:hydrogenase large subunit [Candidatus Methanomassiliicoccus intestinalis]|jgi:NADH-ubiquinone oxidoreductase chain 49kDa|uniref:NADH dehydrogenase n=1 Tax=Candidatus Methanomassiliicoccus intestinalis TaxID=1406512 RepID=A0A8J8PDJ4_9ARCH|nr:MAG: NADH dehydrogenase [Candidatus Methanomassiliicoccus intestinalis]